MRTIILNLCLIFSTSAFSQQWQDVGGGIDLWVNVMKVDTANNLLYVGGDYSIAGGQSANSIATWNGSNWSSIGANDAFSGAGSIQDITFFQGDLIVGGLFGSIGNQVVNNIARFDGTIWTSMGFGFDDQVYTLEVYNGELYAGGSFSYSGTDTTPNIAKWTGTGWQQVGDGLRNGWVTDMQVFNGKLCVGGQAFSTSTQTLPCVGSWDGIVWEPIGYGFTSYVASLGIFENELYAVGDFAPWALNQSTRISRWDGNEWQPMPFPFGGNDQRIVDIEEYNSELYICGYFNNPPDLARYNGIGYDSLCDVIGFISNLTVYKNELYVGGLFNSLNMQPVSSIARFNSGVGLFEPSFDPMPFSISPNPGKKDNIFRINIYNFEAENNLKIYTSKGEIVNYEYSNERNNITFSNLNAGLYIVTYQMPSSTLTCKLIITP